ncbi:MAG: hypothetical protein AAFO29_15390 [Actinomycetota bacterium]
MKNPIVVWGAIFFVLFFIFTEPGPASGAAEGFGDAAVNLLDRLAIFVNGLLEGASSDS